jgi:hypothetical protein
MIMFVLVISPNQKNKLWGSSISSSNRSRNRNRNRSRQRRRLQINSDKFGAKRENNWQLLLPLSPAAHKVNEKRNEIFSYYFFYLFLFILIGLENICCRPHELKKR